MDRLFDFMKEVRKITMPYGYGRERFKAVDAEEMDQVKIAESSGRTRFNEQFLIELNRLQDIKVFADMLTSLRTKRFIMNQILILKSVTKAMMWNVIISG